MHPHAADMKSPSANPLHRPAPLRKAEARAVFAPPEADGTFEGYASVFGFMDLGHDVVMPGAFEDTLRQKGVHGVRLLYQHDPARPIGRWQMMEEDGHGLFVRGQLDLAMPKARQAFAAMQAGALTGLSIGYRTKAERVDRQTGLRRLDVIELWEISLVTRPLNPKARVLRVKMPRA